MKRYTWFWCLLLLLPGFACKQFVDVELTKSRVPSDVVFKDNNTATSALYGVFMAMSRTRIANELVWMGSMPALSSDELENYPGSFTGATFVSNSLQVDNAELLALWQALYAAIYQVNAIYEGAGLSESLTPEVKNRLMGEALFVRAFCHFYLVDFFGKVPVITHTDYRTNALESRKEVSVVYEQIKSDLIAAEQLLPESYADSDRFRANKFSAKALLARVYLYLEDWENAEIQASAVIGHAGYALQQNLDNVFLKSSKEAIWQLLEIDANVTNDAYVYAAGSHNFMIRPALVASFNVNDKRRQHWIGSDQGAAGVYYFPHKYKMQETDKPIAEYPVMLRFAEQFLIRAEARAWQDKLGGAISDLDSIRHRAGLPLIANVNPSITKEALLLAIEQERRWELFAECGHRWMDLKRTGRAVTVLSAIKPGFTKEDQLYPIPEEERRRNPKLGEQNAGY